MAGSTAARFIPPDGDGAGVQNATAEHIHVRPYRDGGLVGPGGSAPFCGTILKLS